MANILRMDLYRLVHGKSLWIFLAVIVVLAAAGAGTMAVVTDPAFIDSLKVAYTNSAPASVNIGFSSPSPSASDLAEADAAVALLAQGMTAEALIGNVFLGGGGLSCLFAVFVAIFLAAEFESGFSKNVFTVQPNRFTYLAARTIEILILAVLFTVLMIAATFATAAVTGLEIVSTPAGDLALWTALVTLAAAGFGMITALAVWITRKMAAGIVIGIVVGAGLVGLALKTVLVLFPSAPPLTDYTLSSCMSSLALGLAGPLGAPHIALVSVAFIAVAAVASAVVLQRKDI
ncbi:ABC transporter permease [Arabiibacter massiliensis]|uniref:ABC transporter permease n=1 Tax=Arabiibacter massiliensis TaxID=1870985 RepID=UPI001E65D66A|nr:ABC transporter permease [Arabiibacter massiliensis]